MERPSEKKLNQDMFNKRRSSCQDYTHQSAYENAYEPAQNTFYNKDPSERANSKAKHYTPQS